MAVSSDDAVAGSDESFFGEQSVLDAHIAHIEIIPDAVLLSEITALLALCGCLDILIGSKVIHYHCDLILREDRIKSCLIELIDCDGRSNVVSEDKVEVCHNELTGLYLTESCMSCEDLLCHCHSHSKKTP